MSPTGSIHASTPAKRAATGSLNSRLFAQQALNDAKREGLVLAVRARWVALAVIAVMLPLINPRWGIVISRNK